VPIVDPFVDRKLRDLPKAFRASRFITRERFLPCMYIMMFFEILLGNKGFVTLRTSESFNLEMSRVNVSS
jgi:hypothetical protein